jgi:hypothetical protein
MARGWESKAVEAQQEESASRRPATPARTAAERAVLERRTALTLARARALDDLSRAVAPAHRQMLEATLQAIERDLAALDHP